MQTIRPTPPSNKELIYCQQIVAPSCASCAHKITSLSFKF